MVSTTQLLSQAAQLLNFLTPVLRKMFPIDRLHSLLFVFILLGFIAPSPSQGARCNQLLSDDTRMDLLVQKIETEAKNITNEFRRQAESMSPEELEVRMDSAQGLVHFNSNRLPKILKIMNDGSPKDQETLQRLAHAMAQAKTSQAAAQAELDLLVAVFAEKIAAQNNSTVPIQMDALRKQIQRAEAAYQMAKADELARIWGDSPSAFKEASFAHREFIKRSWQNSATEAKTLEITLNGVPATIPSIAFRHLPFSPSDTQATDRLTLLLDHIRKTGSLPPTTKSNYLTTQLISANAADALQTPHNASIRIELDLSILKGMDLTIPKRDWGMNPTFSEAVTRSYLEFGSGGATQFVFKDPTGTIELPVRKVLNIQTGEVLWERQPAER